MADFAPTTESVKPAGRAYQRGPLIFAAILSAIGVIYVLVGSVTVVPFISDERRREPIRKMWAALSRDLPDVGHPGPEKVGFWIVVALTAILSIALMLVAATVTDTPESESDSAA
ncbi:hypothetical protein BH09CHL1_BH09CHL1_05840 [soil metagenome]